MAEKMMGESRCIRRDLESERLIEHLIDLDSRARIHSMESKRMPRAYAFKVERPNQLVDIMIEEGVYLPMDIGLNQMANIRFVILTRHLRQVPFDIIKIDDLWFIEQVFHSDLKTYFKQGDRLLIINKTMISAQLQEEDIFKLILHSSIPFLIWVTWNADTFFKYQTISQQCSNETAYIDAKAYLLKTSHYERISLYDHLAFLIANAIQNPEVSNLEGTTGDALENLNMQYPILRSDLRSAKDETELTMVKIHAHLLEGKERDSLKPKDYRLTALPSLMEMAHYCSSAGYGLHTTEIILIWAAMKRLYDQINCTEMKFWGKIFGLHCDYYIVQIQHEEEIASDQIDISNRSVDRKRTSVKGKVIRNTIDAKDFSMEIPVEPHGIGANQYTYFVTNSPGLPWIKLPDVKPTTINQARKIRCLFTGCLSSEIEGFSPHFGFEKDYLRAQIARLTATTHISPAGYYLLAENEDDDEEEATFTIDQKNQSIRRNGEFNNDPTNLITAEFLANTNLQEWVHSLPEILPQGRTQFWRSPSPGTTNVGHEEEDHEEISEANDVQIPAPRLQPIGDDKLLDTNQSSWSIGLTMSVMHEYSLCYVRSNVWPGAFTLGHAGNHYNLYVGWGQKYEQFDPPQPPLPELEYVQQFSEIDDPAVELEHALEEAQRAATAAATDEEEEEDYEELYTDVED